MFAQRIAGLGQALFRGQDGIIGPQKAIILIAFVVIASVFGFALLSAGASSAGPGKETVYGGIKEARVSTVLQGNVQAFKGAVDDDGASGGTTTDGLVRLRFSLTKATAHEPVDLTPPLTPDGVACADGDPGPGKACYNGSRYTVHSNNVTRINYWDQGQRVDDLHWEVTWPGECQEAPCDQLLEASEMALVTVWLHGQQDLDATAGVDLQYVKDGQGRDAIGAHLATLLVRDMQFGLEVVPREVR